MLFPILLNKLVRIEFFYNTQLKMHKQKGGGVLVNVGILTNIPAPYRKPMWEAYAGINNISLEIYYYEKMPPDRKWGYEKAAGVKESFLPEMTFLNFLNVFREIWTLAKAKDIWIVGGYGELPLVILILVCMYQSKPYILLFDGINPEKIPRKENFLKFWWKKFLTQKCFGWLGNGTVGKEYAKKLGLKEEQIYNQFLTVDIKYFKNFKKSAKKIRSVFRDSHRIDEKTFLIIYSGRLIEHKGIEDLIQAYKIVKQRNQQKKIELVIAGHGVYESFLREKAAETTEVHFIGHVEYKEIHMVYYSSELLVLSSYNDPWGLVINEALACGTPVIASSACGAVKDLLESDFVFKPGDINTIVTLIESFLKMSEKGSLDPDSKIDSWTFENAKSNLAVLIKKCFPEEVKS